MSTHTPGPWVARANEWDEGDSNDWYVMAGDEAVATGLTKPDARLLAAAPDLLAALKALVEPPDLADLRIEHWQNARAAIAKAEAVS